MTYWPPDVLTGQGLVVYTAIFGAIADEVRPILVPPKVKAICFTDRSLPAKHNGWDIVRVDPFGCSQRTARYHKLCPHRVLPADTRVSIWLDGAYQLTASPLEIVKDAVADGDIFVATFGHPQRRTWLQEARTCVAMGKDDPNLLKAQMTRYLKQGLPAGLQLLAETGIVVRSHLASLLRSFGDLWWNEVALGSVRDQVSFPYVCWKLALTYRQLPGRGHENRYARYFRHKPKKRRVTKK